MAITELIPVANTVANSADIVVAAGAFATIGLKTSVDGIIPQGTSVRVYIKDDGGKYQPFSRLSSRKTILTLQGAATYRVSRAVSKIAVGVFQGG